MSEWQPIETAPLLTVVLGFWKPDPRQLVTPECYGLCKQVAGEWESVDGESWAEPDAWMPLPAPPVKEDEK